MKNIENLTFPHVLHLLILKKAFDSVDRDKLWTTMSHKGIPTHLITIIQKICMENIIRVNAGNGISEDSSLDKDAHYHLFHSIYIWMKLLGFGYSN